MKGVNKGVYRKKEVDYLVQSIYIPLGFVVAA